MSNVLKTAYKKYRDIDTVNDLKKNRLTFAEYEELRYALADLCKAGKTATFIKAVAQWLKRAGFKVSNDDEGVNYIITL